VRIRETASGRKAVDTHPAGKYIFVQYLLLAVSRWPHPMVAAYQLIWTVYGSWLPNDPRGSSSHTIRSDVIAALGELHQGRKKVQPASADLRRFCETARSVLKHELRILSPSEIDLIAESFSQAIQLHRYTCYACAIMPDHVHILIRKHRDIAENMIRNLQDASALRLVASGCRRADHPVWGGPGWKEFLETQDDIRRTVRYIEGNPAKAHRPPQTWPFVRAYGWMPGAGPFGRPILRR
jgi:REP element-mobilizing transposase RayT